MSLILDGTNGLSDVDGSAATPAIRGSDANTGVFFGADQVGIATNGVERVEFGNSETVFNDGGADVDFRVESDTDANALFVQGSDGNVGIGTGSPTDTGAYGKALDVQGSGGSAVYVRSTTSPSTNYGYVGFTGGAGNLDIWNNPAGNIRFYNNGSERARINSSGDLLVGTTSTTTNPGIYMSPAGFISQGNSNGGSGFEFLSFRRNNTQIGTITQNGTTAVLYNVTSDYRLKEDITPMTGALARNALLNPVKYKWKVDGSEGEGFIAHQLQGPFPSAVSGEKDAVNADGSPRYQGIGTGPLDGHFAACVNELQIIIQEQQAIITALTARVEALEGAQ
jgi:hypothetical protein